MQGQLASLALHPQIVEALFGLVALLLPLNKDSFLLGLAVVADSIVASLRVDYILAAHACLLHYCESPKTTLSVVGHFGLVYRACMLTREDLILCFLGVVIEYRFEDSNERLFDLILNVVVEVNGNIMFQDVYRVF